jgi:ABC-type transport system involved in multi-copper enzyme maturation permease subunit
VLVVQQQIVALLTTPAFAAGSITDEKVTGSLAHLFTAPLDSWEILRGKWLAQMLQGLLLVLPGFPAILLASSLLGLSPGQILPLLLQPLPLIAFLTAAGLLASVWARSTPSAVLALYLTLAAVLVPLAFSSQAEPLAPWALLHPVLAGEQANAWRQLLDSTLFLLVPAVLALALATWRLRPAYQHQLSSSGATVVRHSAIFNLQSAILRERPAVVNSPLRWKDCHFGGPIGFPWLGVLPRWVTLLGVGGLSLLASGTILAWNLPPPAQVRGVLDSLLQFRLAALAALPGLAGPAWEEFLLLGLGIALLAGVAVAIRTAGAVSVERERQTWDVLLTTPLSTRAILVGKLWGAMDAMRPYLVVYFAVVGSLSLLGGWLALLWTVWFWLATWLVMYFMGAVGLECSVRSASSWRSLLSALLLGSRTMLARYLTTGLPIGLLLGGLLDLLLGWLLAWLAPAALVGMPWQIFLWMVLSLALTVLLLLGEAERLLRMAALGIENSERIQQAGDYPQARRNGRSRMATDD